MQQLLTKCQIFTNLPQILHIHKNRTFKSILLELLDQLLLPCEFYGTDM